MIFKIIKKEIAFQCSKIFPIKIKVGLVSGYYLFGNLFYNRRNKNFSMEEILYQTLDLNNKTIIEVGAHIGIHSMYFASKSVRLFVCEPNPANIYFLKKNLKKNQLNNVEIIQKGISNEVCVLPFVSPKYVSAKGTFKADKHEVIKSQKKRTNKLIVELTTIDKIVEQYKIENVYFVKIDTEGYEPFVIEGMLKTLEIEPIIYFEIHGLTREQKEHDFTRILHVLNKYGYIIHQLIKKLPIIEDVNFSTESDSFLAFAKKHSIKENLIKYF